MSRGTRVWFATTSGLVHNGQVQSGTAPVQPPSTPRPATRSVWPGGTQFQVGQTLSSTRTVAGYAFDSLSAVHSFGSNLTGTGTITDPFLVRNVTFTAGVELSAWDPSDTNSSYIKFSQCWFQGDPANPTNGGTKGVGVGRTAANRFKGITIEDCTIGPAGGLASNGGPAAQIGNDKGAAFYGGGNTIRRCDIYGAAIPVYFETLQTDDQTLVQDNWIHDVWSSPGDHTDLINGNAHASNVVAQGNYMDGVRTGGAQVVNAFGIYDDPADASGIWTNWMIDNNWMRNYQTGILTNTSTTRATNPFIVINNIFGAASVQRTAMRTPSGETNNRDESGNQISFGGPTYTG